MNASSSSSDRDPLERLAAEFLERRRRGEHPALSEYAARYPEWAEQIREFFPALEVMEGLKPGSGSETGLLLERPDGAGMPLLERLGEYRILREIGRGGMGVVYEAIQESLGRRVALKTLPFHGRIDAVQMERFQLESRSAARLHHTSIVPVYGVGEHLGVHYYVMQYIQGHGLDVILDDLRRLRAGAAAMPASASREAKDDTGSVAIARSLLTGRFAGSPSSRDGQRRAEATVGTDSSSAAPAAPLPTPIPISQADGSAISSVLSQPTESGYYRAVARLGVQVADALAHAHGQGVLHRDIKPSNLLLDVDGQVWITDFGLAKLEGSDGPTHTGDIVGTLRYMAPERFEGWSDPRSDIYGLGMTLYELLTLHPAFESATKAKLIEQVIHDAPAAPRKHDPRIPQDLETIVLKAIAKEPAERYGTAEAMAADLGNFLADRPIVARRSSLPERSWRWCRRNKAAAGLLAATGVAALALVGVVVGSIDNARVRASRREAVEARGAADLLAESERRLGYFHRIALAEREWQGNNPRRAEQLLEACPVDLRGWEWHYLKQVCHSDFSTIPGFTSQVVAVAFSPDGRKIAAAANHDRSVGVWDATTLQLFRSFDGLDGSAWSVAFSPDGKRLAAGVGDYQQERLGAVRIWNLESGNEEAGFPGHIGAIWRLVFSLDGKRLASAGEDRTVKIWDVETRALKRTLTDGTEGFTSVTFSPDGKYLASATGTPDEYFVENRVANLKIWDPTTGNQIRSLKGHTGSVVSLAYSPDGRHLASASTDRTVRIWDTQTGEAVATLQGHTQFVVGVAFSPDGKRLVSTSEDGTLKVWDPSSGENLLTLWGHLGNVNCVAYSPDGKHIASGGDDRTVKRWDLQTAPFARTLGGEGRKWFTHVAFSADGKLLAAANADQTVTIWDAVTDREIATLRGHTDPIWGLAFSPNGRYIASASGRWSHTGPAGEVKVYDWSTGQVVRTLHSEVGVVWSVAYSPDGRHIATAGGELQEGPAELKVWDATTGRVVREFPGQTKGILGVSFSPDGRLLASASWDGKIKVWDAATGLERFSLRGHPAFGSAEAIAALSVAFSPDGESLAAAGVQTVTIWSLATGGESQVLHGHNSLVRQAVFHPDGERIATCGDDGTVKLWDVKTGHEVLTLRGHRAQVCDVAFSPDGRQLVSASRDRTLKIWDATPWVDRQTATSLRAPKNSLH